jgi:hypothetical protein
VDSLNRYVHHYGPICEFDDPNTHTSCRYAHRTWGFSNSRCTPSGWPATWTLVGYAVDGFKIYASSTLPTTELDQCNGRFTLNAETGKYTYGTWNP